MLDLWCDALQLAYLPLEEGGWLPILQRILRKHQVVSVRVVRKEPKEIGDNYSPRDAQGGRGYQRLPSGREKDSETWSPRIMGT